MIEKLMTCAQCDELLADYFDGDLDARTRARVDAHAASCARCASLIREVDVIREEAAALPVLAPARDLWQGIEARIQPAVVPLATRREGHGFSRRLLGLAAAALVVATSSITYFATRSLGDSAQPVRVVEAPRGIPIAGANDEIGAPSTTELSGAVDLPPSAGTESRGESQAARETRTPERSAPVRSSPNAGRARTSVNTALASAKSAPVSASELAIAPEIQRLQQVLKARRTELDPATVKVVEDNLNLIDVAVKQARAALARDPASGFLTGQLDNVLQKKVELLRTVALLPSRS
jgi:Putative zinc-finger